MEKNNSNDNNVGFFVGIIIATIVWIIIGCIEDNLNNSQWRHNAIEHGAAYYNPTNGVFTWNENK
jgi:hypothetical protein